MVLVRVSRPSILITLILEAILARPFSYPDPIVDPLEISWYSLANVDRVTQAKQTIFRRIANYIYKIPINSITSNKCE